MFIKNPCYDPNPTTHAINIAKRYANDAITSDQKTWIIDQMVRALTYCPLEIKTINTGSGEVIEIEIIGESQVYLVIASNPEWDKGIPV